MREQREGRKGVGGQRDGRRGRGVGGQRDGGRGREGGGEGWRRRGGRKSREKLRVEKKGETNTERQGSGGC